MVKALETRIAKDALAVRAEDQVDELLAELRALRAGEAGDGVGVDHRCEGWVRHGRHRVAAPRASVTYTTPASAACRHLGQHRTHRLLLRRGVDDGVIPGVAFHGLRRGTARLGRLADDRRDVRLVQVGRRWIYAEVAGA